MANKAQISHKLYDIIHKLSKQKLPDLFAALCIFVLFIIIYGLTATSGYIVGSGSEAESMELQRAVVHNGIAHATSYPAYVVLAHWFTRLGAALGGDPFTWATYFSGFTTALALVVSYFLARLYVAIWPALLAVLVFGFSGVAWHIATITEVQGMHLLTICLILYLAGRLRKTPHNISLLEGIAVLGGLGLANHRIVILVVPALALLVIFGDTWRALNLWRVARLLLLGVAPLVFYFDVFFKVPAGVVYGFGTTFNPPISAYNALQIVFGYGQEGLLVSPLPELWARIAHVGGYQIQFFGLVGVIFGLVGLVILARRDLLFVLVLAVHALAAYAFFMTWRQDHKSFLYFGQIGIVLVVGLAAFANQLWLWRPAFSKNGKFWPFVFSLPVLILALSLALGNYAANNRALDKRGQAYYDAYFALPTNSLVYTGGWSPDHWIGLEAQGNGSTVRLDYGREMQPILWNASDAGQSVYLSWWMQMFFGMFSGQNPLLAQGAGFAGTFAGGQWPFVQVVTRGGQQFAAELGAAIAVDREVAPGISLAAYSARRLATGAEFTLYWQATETPAARYAPFSHLRQINAQGEAIALIAQRDYPDPVLGYYPTTAWQAGEIIRDTYFIAWGDAALPPEESLQWAFGFTLEGQRTGEVLLPFAVAQAQTK
jgi:hypothetical protein